MTTHHPTTRRLVYGHAQLHDCLAFADADTAAEEAGEIEAIAFAPTWREVRRVQPTHTSNPVGPDYYDPEDCPADDETFDINEVGSVADGDWPGMVTTRALTLLPEDLLTRFGARNATVFNGDFFQIPIDCEAELVAELRQRGYEVRRDDALINVLDCRSFNPIGD